MMSNGKAIKRMEELFNLHREKILAFEANGQVARRHRITCSAIRRALFEMGVPEDQLPQVPPWPNEKE